MLMDPYFLYTYGSALEMTSAAFSAPGDFFMYLLCVAAIILVRCFIDPHHPISSPRPGICVRSLPYLSICPNSPNSLIVAVPEDEEDHPCTVRATVIRKTQKLVRGVRD